MTSPTFFDNSWHAFSATSPPPPVDVRQQPPLENRGEHSGRLSAHTNPLTEAISKGNAVVYVGSGASIAADLPDWPRFLEELEIEARAYSLNAAINIKKRICKGDYLVAAEMLQNVFGNKLQDVTHRIFGKVSVPTPIHRAIASIPFSLAVTTNYDSLLETAYGFSVPRLTWQNPHDVLQNVRSGIFCVLKLHGDYAVRKSVVLTRSHYRELQQVNNAVLNSLRMFLATHTFLFVGVSFSDPDLLALMDEAKALYGDVFGPHYAIFPQEFFDPEYSEVLERSYNIRTIVADPLEVPNYQCDAITGGVAALLSHIGGISSHTALSQPSSHGFAQYLQDSSSKFQPAGERIQTGWLLRNLVLRLGVSHGYVSMCDSSMPEHRKIHLNFEYEVTDEEVKYSPASTDSEEPLDSIQSCLFLQRKIEDDYIHLSNVADSAKELESQGFSEAKYTPRYKEAGSVLCVPIYVDGHRSGVITLEADAGYLFSKYHCKVAQHFADRIGATRYESNRLSDSAKILKKYNTNPAEFQENMRRSLDLNDLDLQ
nr:SIR2 family protein [Planctomycetota bacterium]